MLCKKSEEEWRWLIQDRLVILWKRLPVTRSLMHWQIKIWLRKSEKESRIISRLPISMRSGWMLTVGLRFMETIWTVDTAGLRRQKKTGKHLVQLCKKRDV